MKYNELVEAWNKSREYSFNYKFEVERAFIAIYQKIAEYLGYKKEGYLNDYMKLFPISDASEEKLKTSSYSLHGAITYEKFGWSALVLQINTNSTQKIENNGFYRFVFYIKKINNNWLFSIDNEPYEEILENGQFVYQPKKIECIINSNEEGYQEKALEQVLNLIPNKNSWDEKYLEDLNNKLIEIKRAFINHLEVSPEKVSLYSKIENIKTDLGYMFYETNDWCNSSFSLLIEKDKNTFPKLNYLFDFHFKKNGDDWFIKLANQHKQYQINNDNEMSIMLNDFCTFRDGFEMWLNIGDDK